MNIVKSLAAAALLTTCIAGSASADDQCKIIFDGKVFVDYGNIVNVEGILAHKDSNTEKTATSIP